MAARSASSSASPPPGASCHRKQQRQAELDAIEAAAEFDENEREEALVAALRAATKPCIQHLQLPDPPFALRTLKLLARSRGNGSFSSTAHNSSSHHSSSSSSLGALRCVTLPTAAKLSSEEAMQLLPELSRDGRFLPADTLARISASTVQMLLRDATHQLEADLIFTLVF
jgi:hypothetical protein